jgi:hypothetical protein
MVGGIFIFIKGRVSYYKKEEFHFYKKGEKFCIIQIFFLPLRQQRPA